jgi:hypothetical protein
LKANGQGSGFVLAARVQQHGEMVSRTRTAREWGAIKFTANQIADLQAGVNAHVDGFSA